jgi:hypothetical protein
MTIAELPPRRVKPPLRAKPERQYETARVSMQQERLIGRVVVIWSKIESALDQNIWELAGLDMETGRYLTRPFGAEGKIKTLKALSKDLLTERSFKELESILNSVGSCQEDRNFIIHAAWGTSHPDPFTHVPLGLSTRPKSDPDKVIGETFPIERMNTIINDGKLCLRALISFLDLLETSPERVLRQPRQG